jgi:thymidylate kinase
VLVALSGIDGSGKSSLAHGLADVLGGLGIPATVVWSRLEWSTLHENRVLGWIAAPAKAVVRLVARDPAPRPAKQRRSWEEVDVPRGNADAGSRLRERSPLVTTVWTAIVAALHAREQRRTVTGHDGVVICDRYTLDSVVHLRRAYAPHRRLPIANRVLALLSPRPDIALFLDVPADVALARKQDAFGAAELERHAAMYREEYAAAGVRYVDASGPAGELLDDVAREVWLATSKRHR